MLIELMAPKEWHGLQFFRDLSCEYAIANTIAFLYIAHMTFLLYTIQYIKPHFYQTVILLCVN